jgi:hypothetical protein
VTFLDPYGMSVKWATALAAAPPSKGLLFGYRTQHLVTILYVNTVL